MSGLRELARARLRELGQGVGQNWDKPPENVVPLPRVCPSPVGQDLWRETAKNELCPTVPRPKDRDSGTRGVAAGTNAGTQSGTSDRLAAARVHEWRAYFSRLDFVKPLHGLNGNRWRGLFNDAEWLLDHFGHLAARDGYSALDLFGVLPGRDGWGGIADRLRSSRSLVMTADLALWRRLITGTPESFARGMGERTGLVLLWEAGE